MARRIVVSGATGFIGSHVWVELANAGFDVYGFDNFSNSDRVVLVALAQLIGRQPKFFNLDLLDREGLGQFMDEVRPEAVLHFAALKSVVDSIQAPIHYYRNNVAGLISLLDQAERVGCRTVVFSSSATVYGVHEAMPLTESTPLAPTNPYGYTKLLGEQLLQGLSAQGWKISCLRYFNPVGAHPSALIGESPCLTPSNLMPYVAQVAAGLRPTVRIFGSDYPTRDGTGVRDYIHVVDLAKAHVCALERLLAGGASFTANVGTGSGHSVLELIAAYEKVCGHRIPYEFASRRPGDVAECFADVSNIKRLLNWHSSYTLLEMCSHSWAYQQRLGKASPN